MFYFFGFLIGIGLYMMFKSREMTTESSLVCVNHKWIYLKQPGEEDIQYMQCETCKKFPGVDND